MGRILSSVHRGNLIPVTKMKNVEKAPKIPMEPRSDLLGTLLAMAVENVSLQTVPVSGLERLYGKNFQLGFCDLGCKNQGNWVSLPSHMNTLKFL